MRPKLRGVSIFLVLVACAALAMIAAACTSRGGGGHGDPCCNATGQTEVPPAALASTGHAASSGYFAEPFIFPTADDCLTLDASSNPILPATRKSVGSRVAVDAAGRYTVAINAAAIGFPVYIAITDGTGTVKAVGVTSTESAAAGDTYHLAPLRFLAHIPEPTLEAALWCGLNKSGQVGDLHLFDVKAFVTSAMAATYVGDLPALAADAALFGTAIGEFTRIPTALGASTAGGVTEQAMIAIREKAEADVDSCLDGTNPDAATIDCTTQDAFRPVRAELYRGWRMVNVTSSDGIAAMGPYEVDNLSITLAQRVGFGMTGTAFSAEAYRRGQILRIEAAREVVAKNASSLGLTPAGTSTALQKLDLLRESAVEYTDPAAFLSTASAITNSVMTTLQQDANSTLTGVGCDPTQIMNGSGVPTFEAFVNNAPANIAAVDILHGIYYPTATASATLVSSIDAQLGQNCTTPAADLVKWRNITAAMSIIQSHYPKL